MGIIDNLKDAAKLAKGLGNMDLYRQILDLQQEVMEVQQQSMEKDKRIKELEEALAFKKKLVFVPPVYYEVDDSNKPVNEPYCPKCFEANDKAVHLEYRETNKSQRGVYWTYYCHACKIAFYVYKEGQNRDYFPPGGPEVLK
jgi:hypothetical protein